MTYRTVPVNVTGPSYQDRSRPVSSQKTLNLYHEYIEEGQGKYILHSFPGWSLLGGTGTTGDSAVGRGATVMANVLYRVVGSLLYSVDSAGVHMSVSATTIAGNGYCTFANDGVNLFIANGDGQVYWYNGSALVQVTDPDIDGATAVTVINNQFVYTKPTLFVVSDVGDGASASGLNAAGAEVKPDNIVRAYAFDQILYLFGENTVERWYNSGVGSPPFDRVTGQLTEVGCAAPLSVANTDNAVYWLGDDRSIYRERGGQAQKISTTAISNAIEGYTTISNAVAYTFVLQGMDFYAIRFPSENKTWCLNEKLGDKGWFELSSTIDGGQYDASYIVFCYGKNIISHVTNGNAYALDLDAYDQAGTLIARQRVLAPISGLTLQAPGQRIKMNRFELLLEKGVGLVSGQGSDPKIRIEASYDGGKSWSPGTWMRIGRLGETQLKAEWWNTKPFYELVLRITITDPVNLTIYGGAIDIKAGGR